MRERGNAPEVDELGAAQRFTALLQGPVHALFAVAGLLLVLDPGRFGAGHVVRALQAGLMWAPSGLLGVAGCALLAMPSWLGLRGGRQLPWMVRAWWVLAFSALGYSFGTVVLLGLVLEGAL